MSANPPNYERGMGDWTGAFGLMQKWLARRSAAESLLNLAGGGFFLIIGMIAMVFTSVVTAGIAFVVLLEVNALLSAVGFGFSLLRPVLFGGLFLIFLGLTIFYAYLRRPDADGPTRWEPSLGFGLIWEVISAGPSLLVLSGQEFHRFLRLKNLDIPQVSALLLWIYDREGRAGFAEICLAFPELNAVRVLPQLRDLPGINWWPEDAELSFTEDLLKTLEEVLHRPPKNSPFSRQRTYEHAPREKPTPFVDPEIAAWYATLELPLFANIQDVKKRYRKLAKQYHPDVSSGNKFANEERMRQINDAYHKILRRSQNRAG